MQNDTYITLDLYLTVYLLSSGREVELKKEGAADRFSFCFINCDELQEEIKTFYARKANVEPTQFCASLKQLKSRMYNFKNESD